MDLKGKNCMKSLNPEEVYKGLAPEDQTAPQNQTLQQKTKIDKNLMPLLSLHQYTSLGKDQVPIHPISKTQSIDPQIQSIRQNQKSSLHPSPLYSSLLDTPSLPTWSYQETLSLITLLQERQSLLMQQLPHLTTAKPAESQTDSQVHSTIGTIRESQAQSPVKEQKTTIKEGRIVMRNSQDQCSTPVGKAYSPILKSQNHPQNLQSLLANKLNINTQLELLPLLALPQIEEGRGSQCYEELEPPHLLPSMYDRERKPSPTATSAHPNKTAAEVKILINTKINDISSSLTSKMKSQGIPLLNFAASSTPTNQSPTQRSRRSGHQTPSMTPTRGNKERLFEAQPANICPIQAPYQSIRGRIKDKKDISVSNQASTNNQSKVEETFNSQQGVVHFTSRRQTTPSIIRFSITNKQNKPQNPQERPQGTDQERLRQEVPSTQQTQRDKNAHFSLTQAQAQQHFNLLNDPPPTSLSMNSYRNTNARLAATQMVKKPEARSPIRIIVTGSQTVKPLSFFGMRPNFQSSVQSPFSHITIAKKSEDYMF
ncbi:hypothetical protein FGO68_gene9929 [Halteria grandinella]|uniref:Uncharacterized protein n=1 Tax=Halteria grandinella TaxID=5974 RepID=A0A8J8P630_HALGN|nr:hypothetical protein FGO68_gene9929 [Halteria grandinella]